MVSHGDPPQKKAAGLQDSDQSKVKLDARLSDKDPRFENLFRFLFKMEKIVHFAMIQARICLFEARPAEKKSLEPEPPDPSPRGENPNASGHLDPQPAEPVDVDDEEDAEVLEEPPQDLQDAVKRMLRSSCADEVMSLD